MMLKYDLNQRYYLCHNWSICRTRGGNSQQFLAVQIFERCPDFHFISNRKSEQVVQKYVFTFSFFFKTQIWPSRFLERCSHFRFWWKSKCEHLSCPNLYRKGVHISIFIKNANVNTFSKIWTARFVIWRNWKCEHLSKNLDGQICVFNEMKIRTPFKNLNGQKLLRISTSVVWIFFCQFPFFF